MTTLPFANGERPLVRYPGKRPLIQLTARPPQLETPFSIFDEGVITPNDAFFVRYHLSGIPLSIDPEAFRLEVKGKVDRPLSLSLADLKTGFEPVELVAVHQCSGNSRGFVEPRVAGGQLGNGAMGNARWHGVPLKAVLDRAGVQAGSRQVTFNGLDEPVLPETPDFVKALDLDHARDGEVMLAYAMNGEDKARAATLVKEIAFDGGYGISDVLMSWDGGQNWSETRLGSDLGRYSFREWRTELRLPAGAHELKVRAINRIGQSQPMTPL